MESVISLNFVISGIDMKLSNGRLNMKVIQVSRGVKYVVFPFRYNLGQDNISVKTSVCFTI